MAAERCGYCGRFMATTDLDGWDIEPRCSQTTAHILADPEHWSVYVEGYDIGNGDTYTGTWPADDLPRHELVRLLEAREHTNGSTK